MSMLRLGLVIFGILLLVMGFILANVRSQTYTANIWAVLHQAATSPQRVILHHPQSGREYVVLEGDFNDFNPGPDDQWLPTTNRIWEPGVITRSQFALISPPQTIRPISSGDYYAFRTYTPSPDGQWIVWRPDFSPRNRLYVRRLNTFESQTVLPSTLTANTSGVFAIAWSLDSRWIYAVINHLAAGENIATVYRIHPDGSGLERLFELQNMGVSLAHLSRDWLVLGVWHNNQFRIYRARPDGSDLQFRSITSEDPPMRLWPTPSGAVLILRDELGGLVLGRLEPSMDTIQTLSIEYRFGNAPPNIAPDGRHFILHEIAEGLIILFDAEGRERQRHPVANCRTTPYWLDDRFYFTMHSQEVGAECAIVSVHPDDPEPRVVFSFPGDNFQVHNLWMQGQPWFWTGTYSGASILYRGDGTPVVQVASDKPQTFVRGWILSPEMPYDGGSAVAVGGLVTLLGVAWVVWKGRRV